MGKLGFDFAIGELYLQHGSDSDKYSKSVKTISVIKDSRHVHMQHNTNPLNL